MPEQRSVKKAMRVLVVLDPAAPRPETLEALACLTGGRSVSLLGLYIEDADLLSLARLPFAREVRLGGGPLVALDSQAVTHALEAQAERVRRLFESASAALRLSSSFRVVRGNVEEELKRAALEADLLLIGRAGRGAGARNWQTRVLGRLPGKTRKTVVYVQEAWHKGKATVVYHDGDEESRSALALAAHMANLEKTPLVVIIAAGPTVEELAQTVRSQLRDWNIQAPVEIVEPLGSAQSLETWRRLLLRLDARVLVVPAGHPEIDDRLLAGLLDRLECSLIVVNDPDGEPADS
jgi:hypothetical protein